MTFKSIDTIICQHVDARRVIRFVPIFDPDESEKRELFCLPALYSWLYQKDRKKSRDYKVSIRAHLEWFVKGYEVNNNDYFRTAEGKKLLVYFVHSPTRMFCFVHIGRCEVILEIKVIRAGM